MIPIRKKTAGIALMILSLPTLATIDIRLTTFLILAILLIGSLTVGAKLGDSLAKFVFRK